MSSSESYFTCLPSIVLYLHINGNAFKLTSNKVFPQRLRGDFAELTLINH